MTETRLIDVRGPRFAAAVTAVVLAVALIVTPSVTGVLLLLVQALAFGAAALLGMRYQPYGWFFRRVLAPRLGPARETEDAAPLRFAQQVGLCFTIVALVGLSFNLVLLAQIAIGFALAAAFLNAVFRFCLGCEIYLLIQRIRTRRRPRRDADADAGIADAATDDTVDADADAVAADVDARTAADNEHADSAADESGIERSEPEPARAGEPRL